MRWFTITKDRAAFWGVVHSRGFELTRCIGYRNSFAPILYGAFEPEEGGTSIRVRLMPHPIVIGFMCLWFSMCGMFGLIALGAAVSTGEWGMLLGIAAMGLAAVGMTYGGFFIESAKSRALLLRILEGEPGASDRISHPSNSVNRAQKGSPP